MRELFIPNHKDLDRLSDYLNKIYKNNCLNQTSLNNVYDVYFNFKINFLNHYPGIDE